VYKSVILGHLKTLVEFYPVTESQTSVKTALEYCHHILKETGYFKNLEIVERNGHYSLVAYKNSSKNSTLLLQGHIDVVKSPNGALFYEQGNKIYGRGVWDMLYAVACYLTFIELNSDQLDVLDIAIMITGDEEIGGFYGSGWLTEQGYSGRTVFIPDSGEGFGDLCVASKGAYNLDLVALGRSHHGSRPWEGDGAANKLILMIHELMDAFDHSDKHNSTLTVTSFESGGAINRGPSRASAHLDIRFKDQTDLKKIQSTIDEICAHYGGEITNILHADDMQIETDRQEIRNFIRIYEEHAKHQISLSKSHGGSDARFFNNQGSAVIMIRPDGGCAHSDEEYIDKTSLMKFYQLMEDFILKTAKIS